jgi:hypothetical protein
LNTNPDIRWRQRFQNFDRVFVLLRSAMENGPDALNPLEKEGVIQCFECFFELAWKTMKDYLEEGGFVFAALRNCTPSSPSPRNWSRPSNAT